MVRLINRTISVVCVLALLCALGGATFVALKFLLGLADASGADISATTAATLVVVLAASLIVAGGVRGAGKRIEASQLLAPKAATYQLAVALWGRVLPEGGREQEPAASAEELEAADRLLALYGSASVIRAHGALRAAARGGGAAPKALLTKMLLEMRRDLGAETWGLRQEELSRLLAGGHEEATPPGSREAFQGAPPRASLAPNP